MIRLIPNNVDNNDQSASNATDTADHRSSIEYFDTHDFEQWMFEEIEESV